MIFGQEFYPTPESVIEQMTMGMDMEGKTILEPSAGSGNIVDHCKRMGAGQVLAYEKEPELRTILENKAKVLGNDFLKAEAQDLSHVDYIIMNPPFSNAVDHILKAWEVAPEGCEIVAICNTESIDNRYTRARKELHSLITNYGEAIYLGDVFKQAERKTGVEITMVKLFKPATSSSFDYEGFYLDMDEEVDQNGIMEYNEIRNIVNRYVGAMKVFDLFKEKSDQISSLLEPILGDRGGFQFQVSYDNNVSTKEAFAKEVQKASWKHIFSKMNLDKFVTSGVMGDINKFVETQSRYPFTMKNVYKMLDIIVGTREQTMNRSMVEIFDKVTKHYHDNRYNLEGWKTNSHYLLGEKFILPYLIEVGYNGQISTTYRSESTIDDLNKTLCWLTGKNYDDLFSFYDRMRVTGNQILLSISGRSITEDKYNKVKNGTGGSEWSHRVKKTFKDEIEAREFADTYFEGQDVVMYRTPEWGKWADWDFFEFRCYKKGTIHFKFKREDVWASFNAKIAQIKGFPLPESIKKKAA